MERRKTEPTLDIAAKLAVFFDCSISELFDLDETDEQPNDSDEEELLANYRKLNDAGQEKLVDYSNDLVASGNYTCSSD